MTIITPHVIIPLAHMARPKTSQPGRINAAVARLRQATKMTQAEFAAFLGVSLVSVGNWETFRQPTGDILVRLRRLSEQMAKDARNPEDARKLDEIDNILYSALVQQFPAYRMGLVDTVKVEIWSVINILVELSSESSMPDASKVRLLKSLKRLFNTDKYVQMFSPMYSGLPETPTAFDVAESLAPMVLEAYTGQHDLPADVVRRETERLKRAIRRKRRTGA